MNISLREHKAGQMLHAETFHARFPVSVNSSDVPIESRNLR